MSEIMSEREKIRYWENKCQSVESKLSKACMALKKIEGIHRYDQCDTCSIVEQTLQEIGKA